MLHGMGLLMLAIAEGTPVVDPLDGVVKTLLGQGVVGVIILALGWICWVLDARNRVLYQQRVDQERLFGEERAAMLVKYRETVEHINQTLDVTNRVVERLADRTGG